MGLGAAILVDDEVDHELGGAASVEVYECAGEMTTYRLRYAVDIAEKDLPLLGDARLSVGSTLAIVVDVGGQLSCLVKGPVYGQQIHLVHGGAGSYVDVLGADTSLALDRESKAKVWPDATDAGIVAAILTDHFDAQDVEDTASTYDEAKHLLVQRESDLAFIRRLARRNGCLFWVTCDEDGTETGHFKRPPLDGEPLELAINNDPPALASLDITWDAERPVSATAAQVDLNTKSVLDGSVTESPLAPLGAQAFSAVASSGVRSLHVVAPVDDAGDLSARAEAALIEAGFFIRARCATTAQALGKVVRAHTVVKVNGAGRRHGGNYFCAGVRHTIDPVGHHMDIELLRNGWGG